MIKYKIEKIMRIPKGMEDTGKRKQMLRIAICDDDVKFTGSLDILVQQVSHKLGGVVRRQRYFLTGRPW